MCAHVKWGERVLSKNYGTAEQWKLGTVKEKLGNITYMIQLDSGQIIKRHVNQLRSTLVRKTVSFDPKPVITNYYPRQKEIYRIRQPVIRPKQRQSNQTTNQQPLRRSARDRCQPSRFGFDTYENRS